VGQFQTDHYPALEDLVSKFAEPMARLIDELKKLPGVGSKSAQRMAFHILRSSGEDAEALAAAIRNLKEKLHLCSVCNNITDVDPCSYCSNATRNQRLVCVVEEPTNIASIEKARFYNGVYHVLHGAISPLHGVGPEQLRIPSLLKRIESGSVDEVIIATNPTIEGEATAIHLSGLLKRPGLKVTRIATGIPAGSDIEYADEVTMLKAMEGRREL
jgi:recombination protein RecR